MRIHSDKLTLLDMKEAAVIAQVWFTRNTLHGSKKRHHAFDVILAGNSTHKQNGGDNYAATWDQWGIFLSELYRRDPEMVCNAYPSLDIFNYATGYRFNTLTVDNQHKRHKWENAGPYYSICECGAEQRWDWRYQNV